MLCTICRQPVRSAALVVLDVQVWLHETPPRRQHAIKLGYECEQCGELVGHERADELFPHVCAEEIY